MGRSYTLAVMRSWGGTLMDVSCSQLQFAYSYAESIRECSMWSCYDSKEFMYNNNTHGRRNQGGKGGQLPPSAKLTLESALLSYTAMMYS